MAQSGMARTGRMAMIAFLALAGCGDYTADYPSLMPTDQLLAAPALPAHAAEAATSPDAVEGGLAAKQGALHGRADRALAQGGGSGNLAARAAALRARAKTLAATPVQDEAPDPALTPASSDCPDGRTDCPAPVLVPAPQTAP